MIVYYIFYILLFIALPMTPEKQNGAEKIFFNKLPECPMANFGPFSQGQLTHPNNLLYI